jgi:hypothetical protein
MGTTHSIKVRNFPNDIVRYGIAPYMGATDAINVASVLPWIKIEAGYWHYTFGPIDKNPKNYKPAILQVEDLILPGDPRYPLHPYVYVCKTLVIEGDTILKDYYTISGI